MDLLHTFLKIETKTIDIRPHGDAAASATKQAHVKVVVYLSVGTRVSSFIREYPV